MHLVLLIGFLVNFLFEVEAASLSWFDEGSKELSTLEVNILG